MLRTSLACMSAALFISGFCAPANSQQQSPQQPPPQQQSQQPAPPPTATTKVMDNVYIFRYMNHQAMFVVTPAGVIATDPMSLRRPAQPYTDAIQAVTKAPIKTSSIATRTSTTLPAASRSRTLAQRSSRTGTPKRGLLRLIIQTS
jgi:hypothetical protein